MARKKPSKRDEAWPLFDYIVAAAAPKGSHSNPWFKNGASGVPRIEPDYGTLQKLLGVPLHLKASTQSGVPALALDVWLSYELRRAGFTTDQVWPRPRVPRILPTSVSALIASLTNDLRSKVDARVSAGSITGVTSSAAAILGKNYLKQVDVIITDWATGPELLVSTKRMDSSYGKNAPNRVEESYGDAKNLRLRHPLAALGFVFGLRSDILTKEPTTFEWLVDLLAKLGREDDAYHATCLVLMEYSDEITLPEPEVEVSSDGILEPGPEENAEEVAAPPQPVERITEIVEGLPTVTVLKNSIPEDLSPERFLTIMVNRVLSATPVNMHEQARARRATAQVR